jgi:pteridine reductase
LNLSNTQDTRVALITGAARRIGATIAKHLHQAGFLVVIHCHHSIDSAHALGVYLNHKRTDSAYVLTGDLCKESSIEALIQKTLECAGRLDLLVNNASLFSRKMTDWDTLFQLNVKAPFLLSHAAFAALSKTQGSIINITDAHTDKPLKDYAIYCQSKAALTMQTKALAREFAPNVRVNAVAPGAILWPEHDNALSQEQRQRIINDIPLKRHGAPLFIAKAVLALADNPFITGQVLCVDGGRGLM